MPTSYLDGPDIIGRNRRSELDRQSLVGGEKKVGWRVSSVTDGQVSNPPPTISTGPHSMTLPNHTEPPSVGLTIRGHSPPWVGGPKPGGTLVGGPMCGGSHVCSVVGMVN